MKRTFAFALFLTTVVVLSGCTSEKPIGGERDVHGCLTPAGYSWDDEIKACLRPWEIKDESQRIAAKIAVEYVGQSKGLTVVQVDVRKCQGCFVVHFDSYGERTEVALQDWNIVGRSDLTYEEALLIAQESACTKEGNLTNASFYNENTKTWWIGLDAEKPGCAPACVVSEDTRTAEINWRCTGAIPD